MKQNCGFTLPELLVVLIILAILLTWAVPSFVQSWQQVTMDVAIQQLHRDLRWAQELAAKEQKLVSVTFFQDKQPYRYVVRISGKAEVQRRREFPNFLKCMEAQTIFIQPNKKFQKNGHVLLQKGEEQRYVYYYQTGRSRITNRAAS